MRHHKTLTVLYLNVRSIISLDKRLSLINIALVTNADIIYCTETWLNASFQSAIFPQPTSFPLPSEKRS